MAPKANMPPAITIKGTGAKNHISAQSAINEGNNNPNKPGPVTRVNTKITRYANPGAEVNVPTADQGQPIPYLIGRRMLSTPCAIWTGIPQTTQTVSSTEVVARYETIPRGGAGLVSPGFYYQYQLRPVSPWNVVREDGTIGPPVTDDDLPEDEVTLSTTVDYALALCLGPGVALMAMYDENGNVLSTTVTSGGEDVTIAPSVGRVATFYGGEWDQPRDPTIAAAQPNTPAYRGISYIVITEAVLDNDTPLASVFFECVRPVNFLQLTDAALIASADLDMNIANAICDLLTNDWGSIGLPSKYIDFTTFTAAAETLANEGNWCSVLISDKTSVKSVIGGLTAQANGCIRWNPKIGQFQFVLYREAEDVLMLPLFDKDNTQSIADFSKQTWYGLPQGINFSFVDRQERYNPATVLVGLNRQAEHADVIMSETFDSVCEPSVMEAVVRETFKRLVTPLLTGKVMTNRDAETVFPGDAIRITKENARGVTNFPVRITTMKETGRLFDTYSLEVTQDVFPYRKAQFDVPVSTAPNTAQEPVLPNEDQIDIYDAPLFFLTRTGGRTYGATLNDDMHVSHIMVRNGQTFYAEQYAPRNGGFQYVEAVPMGNPTPRGTLNESIAEYDGYDSGTIANIVINNVDFPAYLNRYDADFNRAIGGMMRIGDELLFYSYGFQTSDTEYTAYNVTRGIIDTVPKAHSSGAEVDFIMDYTATSKVSTTGLIDLAIKGVAGLNSTPTILYVEETGSTPSRARLPACPHNGQINASGDFDTFRPVPEITRGGAYKVVWKERSRQATRLATREATQAPAETTTYTVSIRTANHFYQLATGVSGGAVDVVIPAAGDIYAGNGVIEIKATTANGDSLNIEKVRLTLV